VVRAHYRKGAKVNVRHSPANPDLSILEPGNVPASWLVPGIGAALLLFAAAIFKFMIPAMMR
jgi:hypothetical protein